MHGVYCRAIQVGYNSSVGRCTELQSNLMRPYNARARWRLPSWRMIRRRLRSYTARRHVRTGLCVYVHHYICVCWCSVSLVLRPQTCQWLLISCPQRCVCQPCPSHCIRQCVHDNGNPFVDTFFLQRGYGSGCRLESDHTYCCDTVVERSGCAAPSTIPGIRFPPLAWLGSDLASTQYSPSRAWRGPLNELAM